MVNKRKNKKKLPKSKRKSRQELETENIQLIVKIEQTEARMDAKYLRKLEKKNRDLGLLLKTKELHIIDLNKKIVKLATKIISEESFSAKLERKNKEMRKNMKRTGKK